MKCLRTFILLLLCAALPLSGLAASGVLASECPMQRTMSMDSDATASADMAGCDTMKASTVDKTQSKAKGMFCKMAAQCQSGCLYHLAIPVAIAHPAAQDGTVAFHYTQSLPVRDPNGLWRPPRLA